MIVARMMRMKRRRIPTNRITNAIGKPPIGVEGSGGLGVSTS
jgi:hypothetical protein